MAVARERSPTGAEPVNHLVIDGPASTQKAESPQHRGRAHVTDHLRTYLLTYSENREGNRMTESAWQTELAFG